MFTLVITVKVNLSEMIYTLTRGAFFTFIIYTLSGCSANWHLAIKYEATSSLI